MIALLCGAALATVAAIWFTVPGFTPAPWSYVVGAAVAAFSLYCLMIAAIDATKPPKDDTKEPTQ